MLFAVKLILEFLFMLCYTKCKEKHLPMTDAFHTDSILFQKWMLPSNGNQCPNGHRLACLQTG